MYPTGCFSLLLGPPVPSSFLDGIWIKVKAGIQGVHPGSPTTLWVTSGLMQGYWSVLCLDVLTYIWSHLNLLETLMTVAVQGWGPGQSLQWAAFLYSEVT